jgi:carboxymethylenebutenolidase
MLETTVRLETADGSLPVEVFGAPGAERKGGVIFYMDAFGLRPELDNMCRRYAEAGYVTFLPDLYYRLGRVRFAVPAAAHEPLDSAMVAANVATTVEMTIADTGVLLRHVVETPTYGITHFGTVGYCMGARHALGAGATFRMQSVQLPACTADGSYGMHPIRRTCTSRASRARSTSPLPPTTRHAPTSTRCSSKGPSR